MPNDVDYETRRPTCLVLTVPENTDLALFALVKQCGCTLVAEISIDAALESAEIGAFPAADYLLAPIPSVSERTADVLSKIAAYLNEYGTEALIWAEGDQLDAAFAILPPGRCHFFTGRDDFAVAQVLSGMLKPAAINAVGETDKATDYGALSRISDELAGFARTLARIADQDEAVAEQLHDMPVSFRPAPADFFAPIGFAASEKPATQAVDAAYVRALIKARRRRDSYFSAQLFADSGWDILLDLFAAKLEAKKVSVSSLCIAAAVPATTALRWITAMTEDGLLVREQDPNDARRVFIGLSDDSEASLTAYFIDQQAGGSMPI